MKRLSVTATAAALTLAFAGHAWATQTPVTLSESQLDTVVAGSSRGHSRCNSCGGGGLLLLNNVGNVSNFANGNAILSGNNIGNGSFNGNFSGNNYKILNGWDVNIGGGSKGGKRHY